MKKKTVILPVRLDSYGGKKSALEAHFFKDSEEYQGKSVPDDSMWIAVFIVNGKIDHSMTDYGYRSLENLLKTYKNELIIGLRENRKDAELEEARAIAEDILEELLTKESVLLHIEGELNLPDGAIKKAYRTIAKARKASAKKSGIDRDEVFYSLSIEDIFMQAEEVGIPKKKLTKDAIKQIIERIEGILEDTNNKIQGAIKDEFGIECDMEDF